MDRPLANLSLYGPFRSPPAPRASRLALAAGALCVSEAASTVLSSCLAMRNVLTELTERNAMPANLVETLELDFLTGGCAEGSRRSGAHLCPRPDRAASRSEWSLVALCSGSTRLP